MLEYKCVNKRIGGKSFRSAADNIEEVVQPMLDEGAAAGWRLHSFSSSEREHGINLVFIWERMKPTGVQDTLAQG